MLEQMFANPLFWKYASIPFVAAIVGWGTNWVAIKLTFKPLRFIGIRPFLGWQGIIPSKAGKMARIFVDKTMFRLGTLPELFNQMEPEVIATHVTQVMDQRLDSYTDEVMFYSNPAVWGMMPRSMKEGVCAQVRAEMPRLVRNLIADIANNVDELIDFKDMLVTRLEDDRDLLNRLFLEAGSAEFRFIIRSGLYFGFLFGLVQLLVWVLHPAWWVLPAFGLMVGYATNWFAINIVFRPLRPKRFGPWTLQGLFLRRQKEVATVWCRLVTTEIITIQQIIYAMLYGPRADRVKQLIKKHIQPIADEVLESYGVLGDIAVGQDTLVGIRESIGDKAVQVSTDAFDHWPFNKNRAELVERLLKERMSTLPSEEFQDLLRPCFQEDEMKLIIMGGVLGLIAGTAQLLFVFGI